ncbi:MAG: DUF4331 domain-containing protein [Roseiflexaceae bacterium]|nr:DUF4331 domain-containing protein [Roseiflexaceae bacterium]
MLPAPSKASSHREAPLMSRDPSVDNTDVYAFVSPDKPDTVTILANFIPFEEPAGGPNFYSFDENARYELKIDNDGDARPDLSYRFIFETELRNKNSFLYNTGPITSLDDPDWNLRQVYDVVSDVPSRRGDKTKRLASDLSTPPDNIGPRSTPNYEALAAQAVHTIDGDIKVFVGQRDDPFFVDLGSIFDLGGLRPFNPAHVIPLDAEDGRDALKGYNVHTIAMQIPIAKLTRNGKLPTGPGDPNAVIGIYANASRQRIQVFSDSGIKRGSGSFAQVSRLANPLINEVIIPLGQKDEWNASEPRRDSKFEKYYLAPELATLVNVLYPSLPDTRTSERSDLSLILLTGVPGLNFTGDTKADLIRLNVAVPPTEDPSRMGVLDGDLAGFPNGRRLADDVTDIELRAIADGYGTFLNENFGLPNITPNNTVGDGVDVNDKPFLSEFPYAASPWQGYENTHSK